MWPLLACSFVAVTAIIERSIFWARLALGRERGAVEKMIELVRKGTIEEGKRLAGESRDYLAGIMARGLAEGRAGAGGRIEAACTEELGRMRRFMAVMDTIITLAPLLGIFGTVVGIIDAFDVLGEMGVADPRAVTGGIAQALITTATGLAIALITLVAYNYFLHRVDESAAEMERYGSLMESAIEGRTERGEGR